MEDFSQKKASAKNVGGYTQASGGSWIDAYSEDRFILAT
jgi:hypothetical protein